VGWDGRVVKKERRRAKKRAKQKEGVKFD